MLQPLADTSHTIITSQLGGTTPPSTTLSLPQPPHKPSCHHQHQSTSLMYMHCKGKVCRMPQTGFKSSEPPQGLQSHPLASLLRMWHTLTLNLWHTLSYSLMRIHTQPRQLPTKKLAADTNDSTSCTQRSSAWLRVLQVILATELRYLQAKTSTTEPAREYSWLCVTTLHAVLL